MFRTELYRRAQPLQTLSLKINYHKWPSTFGARRCEHGDTTWASTPISSCRSSVIFRCAMTTLSRATDRRGGGRVVEAEIGSGLNLPFYRPAVREVLPLESAPKRLAMARRVPDPGMPVSFIEGTAVSIFLDDQSVDTVVIAWTLRTIPGGRGDCRNAARTKIWWQAAVRRTWIGTRCRCALMAGPAHTDLASHWVETGYMARPKPMMFRYEGSARTR